MARPDLVIVHPIKALALLLALAAPASGYAAQPQEIEFPPAAGQSPAVVTPANPFPVEEQGGAGIDGSMVLPTAVDQVLFGGIKPPHGFMICLNGNGEVEINDAGLTGDPGTIVLRESNTQGIDVVSPHCFVTPLGYRPIGPVHVYSGVGNPIAARAW